MQKHWLYEYWQDVGPLAHVIADLFMLATIVALACGLFTYMP